jgi:homospermidine synthase
MNTKEKLELLWKYLLLLVIAVCLFRFSGKPHFKMMGNDFNHGKHEMFFYGNDDHEIDVRVDQEIVDGDTIMKVIVNGEEVDAEEYDMKGGSFEWKSKDGKIMVIDIDDDHNENHKEKEVRFIKKKIIILDEK